MSKRKRRDDSPLDRMRRGICMACGEKGPHFVPPSLGDEGFFYCTEGLRAGKRVALTDDVRAERQRVLRPESK